MDTGKREQRQIIDLLRENKLLPPGASAVLESMSGDGSDRSFYRIRFDAGASLVAVFPSRTLVRGAEEQASAFYIGAHLFDKGVPVPNIEAYDQRHGLLIFEDLGNIHLQAMVRGADSFTEVEPLYQQALDGLIRFQLEGCAGFDTRFCWDTPRYDEKLMLQRESDYFRFSFCRDYMGKIEDDHRLILEFQQLARRAAREPSCYLLHRDFQSRNLLVHQGEVRIIDFQGARLGPLAYDLASLLLDPYAGLGEKEQDLLYASYLAKLGSFLRVDNDSFYEGYQSLAMQRNLQILGAFAFLSSRKGKIFFEQFISPALDSLKMLLRKPMGKEYPVLTSLVDELQERQDKARFLQMDK
ncbi:MAG: phosphotransferase [Pseudomonadota bacterium]